MTVTISILDEVNVVIDGKNNSYVVVQCGAMLGTEIIRLQAKENSAGIPESVEIRKPIK